MSLDVSHITKPEFAYRYEFRPDELDDIAACTEAHGFSIVKGLLPDRVVDVLQSEVRRVVQLLARVFEIDVTVCPACGGRMRIIAALTERASIRPYLEGVGLPARPPLIASARPHPQSELDYAAG